MSEVPKPHLFIGTPSLDGIAGCYFQSCIGLMRECYKRGVNHTFFLQEGSSLISAARNSILREFMKTKCTHALLVDNDIGFEADDVFKMIETGHDFVAGAVPMRMVNFASLQQAAERGWPLQNHATQFNISASDQDFKLTMREDRCVEITFAGTAFLLVSRAAVERMIEAYPEHYFDNGDKTYALFECIIHDGKYHGEDVSFCMRWRQCGGKIYCMPDLAFTHNGPCRFTGRLIDAMVV